MRVSTVFRSLVVSAVAIVLGVTPSLAQDRAVEIDFRGGYTIPTGDLSDLMDPSVSFGMGLNVPVTDRLGVRVRGSSDVLQGKDITSGVGNGEQVANLTVTHGEAGLTYDVLEADDTGFTVDVYGLGGVVVASSEMEEYSTGGGGAVIVDLSTVWPAATGGAQIGYQVTERINVFAEGAANFVFADESETTDYTRLGVIGNADGLSTLTSFPISIGLKLNFPD